VKLPGLERAVVTREKIVDYLLSPSHPTSKAGFFTRFGWTSDAWQALAGPDGRSPMVRTVWMIETEGEGPRLIAADPLRGEA
jgi:hypothetical protein